MVTAARALKVVVAFVIPLNLVVGALLSRDPMLHRRIMVQFKGLETPVLAVAVVWGSSY